MSNMQDTEELFQEYIRKYGYVTLGSGISEQYAQEIISNPHIDTVQISKPISDGSWALINDTILYERKDIWIRVYGFYTQVCDLKFLNLIPRVEKLSIDSIDNSKNIDLISNLQLLKALSLGIEDIKSFDPISGLGETITDLRLSQTRSKKPNLSFLEGYKNLKNLSINGHKKNLEVVSQLKELACLSLSGISVDNFYFLLDLPHLEELYLQAIKSDNFNSLEGLNIKGFGLSGIRGLTDLSFISDLRKLQLLSLTHLNQVTALPEFDEDINLRRVFIDNMRSLEKISPLFKCAQLVDLIFCMDSTPLSHKDFKPLLNMMELKYATIGTGSSKKNKEIDSLLNKNEIKRYKYYDFKYH